MWEQDPPAPVIGITGFAWLPCLLVHRLATYRHRGLHLNRYAQFYLPFVDVLSLCCFRILMVESLSEVSPSRDPTQAL